MFFFAPSLSINTLICLCPRYLLKTSGHSGVEGYIIKNIKNQIDLALQVSFHLRFKFAVGELYCFCGAVTQN